VALTLARHERLLTLEVGVQEAIPESYAVVSRKKLRRAEQKRLETWLGQQLKFE
jgi:hypothetical protein